MSASLFCFFLSPAQPGSPFACHWNNAVFNQNVATMWPGRNRKTDLGEINRPTVTTHTAGVAWPSGLRRWFKAPVSSEAWVRIPPLPDLFFVLFSIFKKKYDLVMKQKWAHVATYFTSLVEKRREQGKHLMSIGAVAKW